ncbi:hypothetical protein [Desulfovibrio legallii]|uniref:Tetratricopeptide repeat protein n=1 Tax=Desulfovibrio legallii TaxID=571438 RepID=A0A6H3F8T3_9BACT|nr:hypothetical protein [Desulfovibrio legallii]TBH78179.1 hypothetical protein EB812_11440 [Desulfovibrio legallii]
MRAFPFYFLFFAALCWGAFAVPARAQESPAPEPRASVDPHPGAAPEKLSAAYYYNRANYAFSREMYAEALAEIDKGMDLDPGFLPFIIQKALVLSRLSRHEDAARFYALALEAKPDDARLAALAVENFQSRRKDDAAGLSADLVRFFSGLAVEVTPELIKLLAERQEQNAAVFLPALRAAGAAGKLTDEELAVLNACLANNGTVAAALLRRQNGWPSGAAPLRAVFAVMTARALQLAGKQDEADAFYRQAAELDFSQETLNSIKAQTYLRLNEPQKAATVYEQGWRIAASPQVWAVRAADAYAASGELMGACAILEKAAKVAPHDLFLQGQLYYRLAQAGENAALKALEQKLDAAGNGIAVNFGKFLFARQSKNREAMQLARQAVVEHVDDVSAVHAQNDIRLIVASLGFSGAQTPQEQQAELMRNSGWELWDSGKIDDAYIAWRDSIAIDPLHGQKAGPAMCVVLLQQGKTADAIGLFHMQYPEMPLFSLALYLVKDRQFSAVYPLLRSMAAPSGANAAWYTLALAAGALEAGDSRAVEASATAVLAGSPPQERHVVNIPMTDAGVGQLQLSGQLYSSIFAEYLSKLIDQQHVALIPEILASRQLQGIPAPQAAKLLSEAGFSLAMGDGAQAAVALWQRALTLSPALPEAHLGMALAAAMQGNMAAAEIHLDAASVKSSSKHEFILGRIRMLEGQTDAAVRHFDNYLRGEPGNLAARYAVFNLFMSVAEYTRARALYSEFQRVEGQAARLYEGQCALALGDAARAETIFRSLMGRGAAARAITPLLVAALRAQDRGAEAEALLRRSGQPDPDKLTALRRQAEDALAEARYPAARVYIQTYLSDDPDSAYVQSLYNSSLRDEYRMQADRLERLKREQIKIARGALNPANLDPQERERLAALGSSGQSGLEPDRSLLDAAQSHAEGLLARNNAQRDALESMLDVSLQRHDFQKAAQISRRMAHEYPYDAHYQLQSAVHAGAVSRFARALPVVRSLSAKGPNGAGMALCFVNVASRPNGESYTPQDVIGYLDQLGASYRLVSLSEFLSPSQVDPATAVLGSIPLLLIVGQTRPEDLRVIDAALAQRGGKAVLLVSRQSFIPGAPDNLPDAALLHTLVGSGRWELALTDTMGRTIVDASGRRGSFWARRGMVNGRPETADEMKNRWATAMSTARQLAQNQGFAVTAWMYPGGDYGQISLNGDAEIRQAYTEAARQVFAVAFVPTANGYHVNGLDPLFVPVRNVYARLDAKTVASMPQNHPTRLAVQTEALLASWHGQLPRAEMLFARAAALGVSPADNAYYRASNALFDEDAPYANELAREAKRLDPDNPRTDVLVGRAERLLHPRVSFNPRGWTDNDGRSFAEYALHFSTFLQENLSVLGSVADLFWESDHNSLHGRAVGIGVRYFPFKQHWLDLLVRDVQPDSGSSFMEARAAWRGAYSMDFLRMNGFYTMAYSRQSLETAESVKKNVYADRLALNSEARIWDWGMLQTEFFGMQRTDGNRTVGGTISPRYIVLDKPQLQVGYLFSAADSDKNPDDYYAPQEYVNHMAVASVDVALFDQMHIRGFAGYGMAKSKDKSWEQVLRYSLDLNWAPVDSWSLALGYRRMELPDYNMDEYSLHLQYIF